MHDSLLSYTEMMHGKHRNKIDLLSKMSLVRDRSRIALRAFARGAIVVMTAAAFLLIADQRAQAVDQKDVNRCIRGGLDWLANTQSRLGSWAAKDGMYPTAMTALAGVALLQEGSTTTQGKYAPNIRRAVDYICNHS